MTHKIPGTDETVDRGSGNVWVDIGYSPEDAAVMSAKVDLTHRIHERIKELGLSQAKAGAHLGLSQPDVSRLMNVRPTRFSVDRLMAILNALEVDIDIVIRPRARSTSRPGRRIRPGRMRVMEAGRV
jgi:predicted XRE-type DNA-binding protein